MADKVSPAVSVAIGLFMIVCPSAGEAKNKIDKVLAGYVGHPLSSYIATSGEPSDAVELSDTSKSFRWHSTYQGPAGVLPMYGMLAVLPPRQFTCDIILTASKPIGAEDKPRFWIIDSYTWNGNC